MANSLFSVWLEMTTTSTRSIFKSCIAINTSGIQSDFLGETDLPTYTYNNNRIIINNNNNNTIATRKKQKNNNNMSAVHSFLDRLGQFSPFGAAQPRRLLARAAAARGEAARNYLLGSAPSGPPSPSVALHVKNLHFLRSFTQTSERAIICLN